MRYEVIRATAVTSDLDLIDEFLIQSYQAFGDDLASATDRAATRIEEALAYLQTFAIRPHRGTEHPAIQPGLPVKAIKRECDPIL